MKDCLIIFAREPKAGKVKTRMQGHLSLDMCVKLYKAFLKDALELARALKCSDKVLAYESSEPEPGYLKTIAWGFLFHKQEGKNLGEKMYHAFRFAKRNKCDKTIIIGSDSPNLHAEYIKDAYRRLGKNDIILGPAQDGGYYLVGLKNPCKGIFKGIKWSSKTVLEDTLKNARNMSKKVWILKKWYDVDDPIGLVRLKSDLKKEKKAAPWTRRLLKI